MFVTYLEELKSHISIELDEKFIEEFYIAILSKEQSHELISLSSMGDVEISLVKSKQLNEIKLSDDFAKGFCKALGGALLCIIPHPVTWGIGGGLVVSGVNDMLNGVDDPNGVSMKDLEQQLSERQKLGRPDISHLPLQGQTGNPPTFAL